MTFSFGNQKSTFGTGNSTSLFGNTATNTNNTTNTFGKSASTGGSLFGNTTTSSTGNSFFGNNTTTTTSSSGGLFGNTTSNTGTSLFGNTTTSSSSGGLFGNTSNTGGTSLFGNTSSNTGGGLFGNSSTTNSGGLFGNTTQNNQAAPQPTNNALLVTARALTQPQLFGDERDQIMAKFNQVLAGWGTGKAFYNINGNGDKLELTPSNHFCRFKTVGYACLPTTKDKDGLVSLTLKKPVGEGGLQKAQIVEAVHNALSKNPNVTVVVDSMRKIDVLKSEVTIYVKEQKSDGTSRKIPASELASGLQQQNIKSQLTTSIALEDVSVRTKLSQSQIKQILDNPPASIDPVIWKQAISQNPDDKKMIPVPMLGFSELHKRLKLQEEMSKGHLNRSELLQKEIRQLQEKQANTKAKIEERKRNLLDLSHRILEVTIGQEVQRKAGLAIQTEEEQLRAQLEALNNQLRAPTQFRGRLNELLSSIRMQGELRPHNSNGSLNLDDSAVQDLKKHLQQQQTGLNHMIQKMKAAFDDLETIESGLVESESRRF